MPAYRPNSFETFVGQQDAVRQIKIALAAAKQECRAFPHTLFSGPPGLGKTTMAQIIAKEMGVKCTVLMSSTIASEEEMFNALEKAVDPTGYDELGNKVGPGVPNTLFVDEIHQLRVKVQEYLYPIMEDFTVSRDVVVKDSYTLRRTTARKLLRVPDFTLIGATTEAGELAKPFRDRFGLVLTFKPYSNEEIEEIIARNLESGPFDILSDDDAIKEIAKRSRGVARVAIGLLRRCIDFVVAHELHELTIESVNDTFNIMGIDKMGLNEQDRTILEYLARTNRAIGLATLAEYLGESINCVSDMIEPYLIKTGLITRTPSGRIITELGKQYLQGEGFVNPVDSCVVGR